MSFTVLMHVYRKDGLTPDEFREHYENKHIPLVKSLTGDKFPLAHTRIYLSKTADDSQAGKAFKSVVLSGTPQEFAHDAVLTMVFDSEAAFGSFSQLLSQPDVVAQVRADCAQFMDVTRNPAAMIASYSVTGR